MKDNKILKFELSDKDFKIKELLKGDFLEMEVWAINNAYPNNNDSTFEESGMIEAIPTFYNRPILGAFNQEIGPSGDFEGHNDNGLEYDPEMDELYYDYNSQDSEIPLGVIRESDPVEIVKDPKTQLTWIRFKCCLWCAYNYKAIKSLLKSRKGTSKVSVEIEVLESWEDDKGIEHITKFKLLGCTILGKMIKEGIENAHLTVLNYLDNSMFAKKQKCLAFAYSALDHYNQNLNESVKKMDELDINESPNEEVNMEGNSDMEGGNAKMNLTMEAKIDLLHAKLKEMINANSEEDNSHYAWVRDIDDTTVYFCYDDVNYSCSYSITTSESGDNEVIIDFENKQRVIQSWTAFSDEITENSQEETTESTENFAQDSDQNHVDEGNEHACESQEVCPDCGKNPCECEACKSNNEEVCAICGKNPCECEVCKSANEDGNEDNGEVCPDCGKNPCECEACGEKKEESAKNEETDLVENKEESVESKENEFADINDGDIIENKENGFTENRETDFVESSVSNETADIFIANKENESSENKIEEACGDKEESKACEKCGKYPCECETCGDKENEVCKKCGKNPCECEADEAKDDECGHSFENQNDENVVEEKTIEINGEQFTLDQLAEKFNALTNEFNSLTEKFNETSTRVTELESSIKKANAETLFQAGKEFIMADKWVDEDSKVEFTKSVEEKCMNYEFDSEEEVIKYAKGLLAMYYYENRASNEKNNINEFSINVTKPNIIVSTEAGSKLKEAITKLKNVNQ